jgi:hypothetical protein
MKRTVFAICLGFFMLMPSISLAQYWSGNVDLFLGAKLLDEDDWEPVEEHGQFGILADFGKVDWPVNVAIGFLSSTTSENTLLGEFEASTSEVNLGIKKTFGNVVRPYIGGGLAFITGKLEHSVSSLSVDSNTGTGFWLNGGVYLTISNHFNIGLDLRVSSAKASIFNYDAKVGGVHAGLVLGYSW